MEQSNDIREFLTSRRERLTPAQVGLPDFGGIRRVKGLRREEVALIAGMSVEYYVRLERGNATGISDGIIDGVSRALQLDEAERTHLNDLVRAAKSSLGTARSKVLTSAPTVGPLLQQLLDAMTGIPAIIQNGRLDVVAANSVGRRLFHHMFAAPGSANFARYLFFDNRSRNFYRDWADSAEQLVALLRIETGRSPNDRKLKALVRELCEESTPFEDLWASHDVRDHGTGFKRIHHDEVGDIELDYQGLDVSDEQGLQLVTFTARAGSRSETALNLLGSLSATNPAIRVI